jgi:hypothetical protein
MILVLMGSIPLFTTNNKIIKDFSKTYSVKDKKSSDKEILYGIVANNYKNEYCDETLKVMSIILYTNYKYNSKDINKINEKDFIKKYGEKKYTKLKSTVDSVYGKYLTYKGKIKYIPYFYKSCGYTKSSKKYPYIKEVASPWDNSKSKNTVGISFNGINQLCKNGCNYQEALQWYTNGLIIAKE